MIPHDLHTRKILAEIESGQSVTQRSLSNDLGIALGLTNLLVRRVVKKGWVKAINVKPNRVRYLITPAGIAEKARITRDYFSNTINLYTETRERIRESLTVLSAELDRDGAKDGGDKRIAFYGAGEVAEIGYVSLQGTDLRLVGVVDDRNGGRKFFDHPVRHPSALNPTQLAGEPFGRLVVMSFRRADEIRAKLSALQFPLERVHWL